MTNYVELRTHSAYSLRIGTASPERLVSQAMQLGMPALALTDHNNVYGAMPFQQACLALNLKPILGAELTLEGDFSLPLLVQNETGWENLCWLITQAQHQADKGEGNLYFDQLVGHTDGLIALSGGREGEINQTLAKEGRRTAEWVAMRYIQLFGRDRFWLELHHHRRPYDDQTMAELVRLAQDMKVGYVATNHVHYATPDDKPLQDVVTAIRQKQPLDEVRQSLYPNGQLYLKSRDELQTLFQDYPLALENSLHIADQCHYQLLPKLQALPEYPLPDGVTADAFLGQLCRASVRYEPNIEARLSHELGIIEAMGLANVFLVLWDILSFAKQKHIRCQVRGSWANAFTPYLLGFSAINPMTYGLVFERFLSLERQNVPDMDIDFDNDDREQVIQYVYEKYGRAQAAMACTFVTYGRRSVIRDVAKAWGWSPSTNPMLRDQWELWEEGNPRANPHLGSFFEICGRLLGNTQYLSIHNGGMILSDVSLSKRVPTEPARMKDRTVVQWDKEALEDAGFLKLDFLALAMLAAISEMVKRTGVDIDNVSYDDPDVYKMLTQAKTFGVFQCESRAQMNTLPRLKPTCFLDLIVAISLIRPGPILGKMVHPYLRRRRRAEEVTYLDDSLKPVLEETLGVVLWQEQVLKIAHDFAGFTYGQGELLRRALGSKHGLALVAQLEHLFIESAVNNGRKRDIAQQVFDQLKGFGAYSFAKSHAASFAVLTYQSAWFKYYYPAVFYSAILNHQPMGFWSKSTLVYDAQRNGISVYPPHINQSRQDCTPENEGFRIGLKLVKGLKGTRLERLMAGQPYTDLHDVIQRAKLPLKLVERLIQAGAMDDWHPSRHQLLWDAGIIANAKTSTSLKVDTPTIALPIPTPIEQLDMEWGAMGLSTHNHPMTFYRDWCQHKRILHSKQIWHTRENLLIQTAGRVIMIQAPQTANGVRFITLEDEFQLINVIVFPNIYQRFRRVIRRERFLWFEGVVQKEEGVVNVIAKSVRRLPRLETV